MQPARGAKEHRERVEFWGNSGVLVISLSSRRGGTRRISPIRPECGVSRSLLLKRSPDAEGRAIYSIANWPRARTSRGQRSRIAARRNSPGRFENAALRTLRADLTTGISTARRRSEDTTGRNCRRQTSLVWTKGRSLVASSSGPAGVPGGRLVEGQVTSPGRPAAGRKPNEFPVNKRRAGSPSAL